MFLAACSSRPEPIIEERTVLTQREMDERIGGEFIRVVQSGDTLYSIAFEAGLDVQKIAAWNGIVDTSRIIAGQTIRLTEPIDFQSYHQQTVKKQLLPRKQRSEDKSSRGSSETSKDKKATSNSRVGSKKTARGDDQARRVLAKDVEWAWPIRGTLVARFNPKAGKQGVDIQGQLGQLVKASSAGEIVYAGDSLKGYGNLIIIKHSDEFLSAYANNAKIRVKEGESVIQGQVIASLGSVSRSKAIAHFQIRRHGNPVDPTKYLP